MSVPGIVQSALDGEEVAARVSLGGDDELFVSPSHTLVYRSEGLLSDESVESFPHDADRLTLSEGRRKTRVTLEYSLSGVREFTVPGSATEDVLHPVLAGLLSGNGITNSGEAVHRVYRFSELTVIVTSGRLVKHIGEAVWDADYEEFTFADVTGLSFEPGSVATQVVLEIDGRPQRIKAPNEQADDLRERLKRALFEYHEVDTVGALNDKLGLEEPAEAADDPAAAFGDGVAPLDANPPSIDEGSSDDVGEASEPAAVGSEAAASAPSGAGASDTGASGAVSADGASATAVESGAAETTPAGSTTDADFEGSEFEPAAAGADESDRDERASPDSDRTDAIDARLASLEATVDRQTELLERQQETIEQLIEELRRGR